MPKNYIKNFLKKIKIMLDKSTLMHYNIKCKVNNTLYKLHTERKKQYENINT